MEAGRLGDETKTNHCFGVSVLLGSPSLGLETCMQADYHFTGAFIPLLFLAGLKKHDSCSVQ